jgi:tetratricopeptide (TPR) repeat protein
MPVNQNNEESLPKIKGKIDRAKLLLLLRTAIGCGDYRFARQAAFLWLAVYPADLLVNSYLAQVFLGENKVDQAVKILEKINTLDPEDKLVNKWLAKAYGHKRPIDAQLAYEDLFVLGERVDPTLPMPGWRIVLRNARKALEAHDLEKAETYLYQALALNQEHILSGITHIEIVRALGGEGNLSQFSELYHARFPDCLVFKLGLVEARLEAGEEAEAINLLHQCVTADAAGQVSQRFWGENHPYRPLWPDHFEIDFDLPIPASVSAILGMNRLPDKVQSPINGSVAIPEFELLKEKAVEKDVLFEDETAPQKTSQPSSKTPHVPVIKRKNLKKDPEWLTETNAEFEKIAKRVKAPSIAKADGRFPIYVVFSTRMGLRSQYGEQTLKVVEKEMVLLADAVRNRPGWGAMVFCPDDIECTGKLGIKTVSSNDPWKLKLALQDLDEALAKKGGRIGALVIVGGQDVVPFHRLPNPTDDMDEEVLSDNPYATLDSNYFIPEWPVGRFPGETGSDPGLLLQQLRQAVKYHTSVAKNPKNLHRLSFWLMLLQLFFKRRNSPLTEASFGYTASVWRRSSLATFRPVGEGKSLLVSPPVETKAFNPQKLIESPLGFYNLHGLAETAEWYGQRDPLEIASGPEYPVALSLADLPKNGHAPKIVFSEACYGGYVDNKREESSLALRFLSIGAFAVVGSTCISYGAVSAPLVGADLLAFLFWSAVRDGYPIGDALSQAKVGMAREMKRRQGFLDGEDQKTLISFVLYGDPLVYHDGVQVGQKRMVRSTLHMSVTTISDHQNGDTPQPQVSERIMQQAKDAVKPYLPGLDRVDIKVSAQEMVQDKVNQGLGKYGKKVKSIKNASRNLANPDGRTVVIFRREVQFGKHTHFNYARVTLNQDGKLMKMTFSR